MTWWPVVHGDVEGGKTGEAPTEGPLAMGPTVANITWVGKKMHLEIE